MRVLVVEDESKVAQALKQALEAEHYEVVVANTGEEGFFLLNSQTFSAKDVDISVMFKTISGQVDASGGLIFRYIDPDNFYVVRANSLEGNIVAYKTENGKRSNIGVKGQGDAYGVMTDVPHRQWNTLRVRVQGKLFEIFFNDRKVFEVENSTFTAAGKVGLWTKADAVTHFDDLSVKSLDAVE